MAKEVADKMYTAELELQQLLSNLEKNQKEKQEGDENKMKRHALPNML
jgi:hypothetical protein